MGAERGKLDDLRETLSREVASSLDDLLRKFTPSTILAVTVVVAEGATYSAVFVNPLAAEGGLDLEALKDRVVGDLHDYLDACPSLVMTKSSDKVPS